MGLLQRAGGGTNFPEIISRLLGDRVTFGLGRDDMINGVGGCGDTVCAGARVDLIYGGGNGDQKSCDSGEGKNERTN